MSVTFVGWILGHMDMFARVRERRHAFMQRVAARSCAGGGLQVLAQLGEGRGLQRFGEYVGQHHRRGDLFDCYGA